MTDIELSKEQMASIIDLVVPMIAAPEDHAFFKGVLSINIEMNTPKADFLHLIACLLAAYEQQNAS